MHIQCTRMKASIGPGILNAFFGYRASRYTSVRNCALAYDIPFQPFRDCLSNLARFHETTPINTRKPCHMPKKKKKFSKMHYLSFGCRFSDSNISSDGDSQGGLQQTPSGRSAASTLSATYRQKPSLLLPLIRIQHMSRWIDIIGSVTHKNTGIQSARVWLDMVHNYGFGASPLLTACKSKESISFPVLGCTMYLQYPILPLATPSS
jgi:hypothetical protein